MKHDSPSLLAALTVGVLVNVLLRSQGAYWPRAGVATALVCVPALAAAGYLFAHAWNQGKSPLLRLLFAVLLFYTSALELLHFWNLAQRLYPGTVSMTAVCLMTLLPVIYLRRVSAISQTAHVVLCLLGLATVFMLLTVLPRLQLTNLQNVPLQISDFTAAAKEQLTLYPEYLLPALWPRKEKKSRYPLLRLASLAIGFDVGVHFLLELFYGAAMPTRIDPVHAVARCGALSVFNRLESLQLILWVMAITLKLALYLYAICLLLDREGTRGTSVRLEHFPLYFAGIWMLCALLRRIDVQEAMQMRSILTWGFALLVGMGGVAAWMCRKIRRCS